MKQLVILIFAAIVFSSCAHTKPKDVFPYIFKRGDCDYVFVGNEGLIKDSIKPHLNRITYNGKTYVFVFDEHKCDIVDTDGLKIHEKLYY